MWYWPHLQLTDYEKKHVSMYKDDAKPGVLRRAYTFQLANQAQVENNIPGIKLIEKYQIARRSRIFAITFTGNTDAWRLSISNTNGTQYTNPAPRSQRFPVVSSLVAGSYYNAMSTGGIAQPWPYPPLMSESIGPNPGWSNQFLAGVQSFPWIIEPNWVCQPNESIIFQGQEITQQYLVDGESPLTFTMPIVLNVTIYAWEFPGMSK